MRKSERSPRDLPVVFRSFIFDYQMAGGIQLYSPVVWVILHSEPRVIAVLILEPASYLEAHFKMFGGFTSAKNRFDNSKIAIKLYYVIGQNKSYLVRNDTERNVQSPEPAKSLLTKQKRTKKKKQANHNAQNYLQDSFLGDLSNTMGMIWD